MSLPMPGGLGWEPWLSSRRPFFFHVVSHRSLVGLNIFMWRLASKRHKMEAAWPPRVWPRTGLHRTVWTTASHRAAWHSEERKWTPPLGRMKGMSLQEWEGCLAPSLQMSLHHIPRFSENGICTPAALHSLVNWWHGRELPSPRRKELTSPTFEERIAVPS